MTRPGFMGTGVQPGNPNAKVRNFKGTVSRLLGALGPEKLLIGVVLACTVVAVALNALGPRVLGHGTDIIFAGVVGGQLPAGASKEAAVAALRAQGQDTFADMVAAMDVTPGQGIDFDALGNVMLIVLALYAAASLASWMQGYLLNIAVQRTVLRLRRQVEEKLNRLALSYFDTHPRGDVLSRVTNDIDNISQSLQQTLSQLLNALLTVVAVLAMMLWISPLLAVIALLTVPLTMLVTTRIAKKAQPHFVAQWKHTGALNAHVEEAHTGHELVVAFGQQDESLRTFDERNTQLRTAAFSSSFLTGLVMPIVMFLGNLNYVLVAVVGGMRVASGSMSLGEVQAFIQYSRQFSQPLSQLASMATVIQSGAASAERVFELLDAEEQSGDPKQPARIERSRGKVEFRDVSFRYKPDQPLIEGFSLTVEPGQMIAIVGPTGAGKTTLVNLLMRFYEIDSGAILVDGVDIRELTRADLRSRMGMVLQDTWLFGGTIGDNIRYGAVPAGAAIDPAADPEGAAEAARTEGAAMVEAARASYADRFVRSLPDGYDSVIDEEADNLSAGEKQLITIARAFISEPEILILDEATSSVDTRTELLLQKAMARLRADRTAFVIAHRLSTIRDADLILVLEDGRIVEQGSHTQLLERRGAYHRLYNSQFVGAQV